MRTRDLFSVIFFFLILTSCSITDHIGEMQLEVMRPGLLNIPENADTIAVLFDDASRAKKDTFLFFNGKKIVRFPPLNFDTLFRASTDSLEKNLEKSGYFRTIYNYADSFDLSRVWDKDFIDGLFRRTKADVCVVLRNISFDRAAIMGEDFLSLIPTTLDWNMLFRNDSTGYFYHQADTLIYEYPVIEALMKNGDPEMLLRNAAGYMGKSCAVKLIPGWMPVERMYYRSGNPEMRKAEKLAFNNDWIGAAEIWNRMSKSKNQRLAAKAAFNMGLACEMEGKPDLAIDWVLHSVKKKFRIDADLHRANCQQYIIILNKRRKDIEKLNLQIRDLKTGQSGTESTAE